ncbi:MAG: PilZ domain-containing protein [bacterium]
MKTVVVVEPLEYYRRFLAQFLSRLSYRPLLASSVGDGMEFIRREIPDLIILGDGFADNGELQLCLVVTNDPLTSDIPIIMIHSDSREQTKKAAFASGCGDYLIKPMTARALYDSVERLIAGNGREQIRSPLNLPFQMESSTSSYSVTSYNFGEGGAFLETDRVHPPGTVLDLKFTLPGLKNKFHLEGEVIYSSVDRASDTPPGMGIKFTELDTGTQALLSNYMEQHLSGPVPQPPDIPDSA